MTNLKLKANRFDELYTPAEAVAPLIKHLPGWAKRVWCPCDTEDSKIVSELGYAGYDVQYTHIKNHVNFFDEWFSTRHFTKWCDMIITNPPYSNKDDFIKRCIDLGKPWALLLPLDALCGDQRNKLYSKTDVGVITLANRLDFTGKGANWFYNAWVCSWPEINGKWIREDIKCVKNKRK